MNPLPRHTLKKIVSQRGRDICASPSRLEALLRDLCGDYRREINVLIGALENRVAADLMDASRSLPREVLLTQLARRLQDNLAYTQEASRWAVESWAYALGLLSEAELAAREKDNGADERSHASAATPTRPQQHATPEISAPPMPPLPARVSNPAAPPSNPPPRARATNASGSNTPPPPPHPAPQPVQTKPAQGQSAATYSPSQPSPVAQQSSAPRKPRRRLLTFRSCLITLLLFIVLVGSLVLVVPAIIAILREEQSQPSINDPRL